MTEKEKITGRLEDWFFTGQSLVGKIYDDSRERFKDGDIIWVSKVKTPARGLREGMVVETVNSKYLLGKEVGV